jgi:acetyltransferase-like isoleucine patch superfamily enzyme
VAGDRLWFVRRRLLNEAIHRSWRWVQSRGAIFPGTIRADRFGSFGEGSLLGFPVATLYGEPHIHIGAGTLIASWVTLAAGYGPDQDDVPERALVIGDRCLINVRCGIVAHESIEIGDDVWFGQGVYITDANHGFEQLDVPIGKQLGEHQPVSVGKGSWLGHGAVILPGAQIGRQCVVAAGSVVRGVVPDHSVVAGVPAKVIRRLDDGSQAHVAGRLDDYVEPLAAGFGTWEK